MMYPPMLALAQASSTVTGLLGASPMTRFWPFGMAPQDETRPYAVHQLVYGTPENTLSCPAATDNLGIQVDAYAKTVDGSRGLSEALRSALEGAGYIVSFNGEEWDTPTGLYRVGFTMEFWQDR
jgi:uncharacterized protein DUF3168